MPIRAKINVSKIDKTALFEGKTGKFLDIILWETPGDEFGNDYRVVQDLPRERRDAGERGEILGNGKNFGSTASQPAPKKAPPRRKPAPQQDPDLDPDDDGGIPF